MNRFAVPLRNVLLLLPLALAPVSAEPLRAPAAAATWDESRLQAGELEGLLLAATRAASAQLAGEGVEAEIVDLRAVPDSLAGLALDGVGRVRVPGGEWIPLRVSAGYDLARAELSALRLRPIVRGSAQRGGVEGGALDLLNAQVAERLDLEFPEQPRHVVLLDVAATSTGSGHAAYRGAGWVQFGSEGQAPLRFSAVLDERSGRLVAFDYALDVLAPHGDGALAGLVAAQ